MTAPEQTFRNKKQRKQQVKLRKPGFAVAKYVRMSPRKVRLVVDVIRGKSVQDAEDLLRFIPRSASEPVAKVLASAIANAENNHGLDVDNLVVAEAWVGKNLVMKRFASRARGRSSRILKPFSEITIVVREAGEAA